MNVATRRSTLALRRLGFTFASDGSHAACLASGADGGWYAESWRLPADGPALPTALPLPGSRSESLHSQLVSLADGTVLVCRHDSDRHEVVLLSAGDDGAGPQVLQSPAFESPVLGAQALGARSFGPEPGPSLGGTSLAGASLAGASFDPALPGATAAPPAREWRLAALRMPGLRLLPFPAAPAPAPTRASLLLPSPSAAPVAPTPTRAADAPVAVALGTDARPVTTVWLVRTDGSAPEQVAELPGLHGGGVWLDRAGRLLGLDRVHEGVVRSVVLDLGLGEVTPLLEIGERSNDRLVLFDPDSRFIMVRSDAPGADRLGWGVLGGAVPLRFPDCLHVPGVFLRPVALRPAPPGPAGAPDAGRTDAQLPDGGRPGAGGGSGLPEDVRVAVQIDHGASSALALWQPAGHRLEPLPVPPGRLGAVAHWSAGGLRMPYSSPDQPAALATLDVDALLGAGPAATAGAVPLPLQLAPLSGSLPQPWRETAPPPSWGGEPRVSRTSPPGWRLDGSVRPADGSRWHSAQSLELAGPAGPLEAVVYGGDAWLSSPQLVLALHGGPADAWLLEFDPALQRMAAEGLAVVAPNQRGSTGYGTGHAMAVRGAWGGPDLEDVLGLLEAIAGQRSALGLEPPALFGVSYGAFLALLAAAHAPPEQVARCAVVAPFLSGARLLAEASAPVRALTTRLGGHEPVTDERGPRDVLQLAHRIGAPLLILHGDRDEVVPVGQSRSLRHELIRLGRVEGADFRYVEAAGAGHELLAEEGSAVLHELLAGFLRTGRAG
ncbi:alpha/beta fold hydrolase [Kitasatospora herbaricolor]|uniref:Alpha/beta fold hydrolase n=1 Tax=Kitasatospora herbaricolor TaxID=68217 RepID=A0ABZ1WDW9_9ACTN|nr:alpha/beta fold hydrolase [Kitasatospora herbaricolor]